MSINSAEGSGVMLSRWLAEKRSDEPWRFVGTKKEQDPASQHISSVVKRITKSKQDGRTS
ncbi:hypothetical protein SCAR479_07111 [Seiridium cardinale]|uniref:Uncharacterized protein n=1 Tax=Seiridium cardinale TaxID=138064 RepID=A0ABR2XQW7_9PEZI